MSPAAGGAAPTQPAAASFDPAPAPTAAIGAPPQPQENLRDPPRHADGADPGNAAARKPAWNVPPPPPPSAAPVGGGIIGGEESWPALADAAAGRAWPKSVSSDSLKSLSDGSGPSTPEDLIAPPSVPSQQVSNPISTAPTPSPPSTSPPPSVTAAAPSPQNGSTSQPDLVRHGTSHGGNNSGGSGHGGNSGGGGGGSESNRSRSSDGNSSSGGDGDWNDGGLGGGSNLNSNVRSGGSNLNFSARSSGIGGSGIDSSRRVLGSNNWNGNGRGGGGSSNDNGNGSGDWGNRNHGGRGGGHWNNNGRNGSNGFGGRGGRHRRDNDRGGNFSPRNYSRALPVQQHQQQSGFYQPAPFQRPPPPPPATHFMMPPPFGQYVPPFAYPADVPPYPFYVTPVEQQFQNMHPFQQPIQPFGAQQDHQSLQNDIQHQIEHYFSTDNLCKDTYLREHMDDQGWVPIDLIAGFPMLTRFTMLGVDTNYILDSLRGSELLEIQGNYIRRRNDWAAWILRRGPPPAN